MKADLLIKGGQVIDTKLGINKECDIAIKGNQIIALEAGLDMDSDIKVNAKGCIVSPGLIDHHLHMFADGSDHGVYPDVSLLPNGVTTAGEGGSTGVSNYELYRKTILVNNKVRIKNYINVCSSGMIVRRPPENIDPDYYEGERLAELFRKYPDELAGLKVRMSKDLMGDFDKNPLEETIKIAGQIGCPVVVHVTNPAMDIEELAAMLRPGDIFCHMYQGTGDTIIGANGKVKPGIKAARERGVVFDACNGRYNYTFDVCKAALADHFLPDVISTDLNPMVMYKHPVISLPYLLSKYINMGMDLVDVFRACTQTPAALLGMEGSIGTLAPGAFADVAIFKLIEQETVFYDSGHDAIKGNQLLVPQMTVKDGTILYRQVTFAEEYT